MAFQETGSLLSVAATSGTPPRRFSGLPAQAWWGLGICRVDTPRVLPTGFRRMERRWLAMAFRLRVMRRSDGEPRVGWRPWVTCPAVLMTARRGASPPTVARSWGAANPRQAMKRSAGPKRGEWLGWEISPVAILPAWPTGSPRMEMSLLAPGRRIRGARRSSGVRPWEWSRWNSVCATRGRTSTDGRNCDPPTGFLRMGGMWWVSGISTVCRNRSSRT